LIERGRPSIGYTSAGALALLALHQHDLHVAARYAERTIGATRQIGMRVLELNNSLILRAAKHALGNRAEVARLTPECLQLARQVGFDPPVKFGGRKDLLKLWDLARD
jgi:hypothetical protein